MIAVGRVGSRSCSFDSVASAGAVKYSRKMNSSDQATDLRAERTDGVVKYRMRLCGSEAVPALMQKARVTNFHLSIHPPVPLCGVFRLLRPGMVSAAGTPRPTIGPSPASRPPRPPPGKYGT